MFIFAIVDNGIVMGKTAHSISNTIFINQANIKLSAVLPDVPPANVQAAIAGVGSGDFFASFTPEQKKGAFGATITAISHTYVYIIAIGALNLILSLLMKREKFFVDQGADEKQNEVQRADQKKSSRSKRLDQSKCRKLRGARTRLL